MGAPLAKLLDALQVDLMQLSPGPIGKRSGGAGKKRDMGETGLTP
jgi:hypothetical protein